MENVKEPASTTEMVVDIFKAMTDISEKRSTPLDVKKCQGSGRRSQNRKGEASGCKNKNQLRETGRVEADRCHAVTCHAFLQGRKRTAGTL